MLMVVSCLSVEGKTAFCQIEERKTGTQLVDSVNKAKRQKAVAVARQVFVAVANGDVASLKSCTTEEFYQSEFPYDDDTIRNILLSVPVHQRRKLIEHINTSDVTVVPNRAGDVMTVIFTNKVTDKDYVVQLLDEPGAGGWKIFSYTY